MDISRVPSPPGGTARRFSRPTPIRHLSRTLRVWPTLASWWLRLCVDWCWVVSSGRVPALRPLNLSFIPIHTVSHAAGMGTETRASLGRPALPTSHTLHLHTLPITRTRLLLAASDTHTYHAPLGTLAKSRAHVHVRPSILPGCPAEAHAPRGFLLRTRPTRSHFKPSPEVGVSPAAKAPVKCSSHRDSNSVLKSGDEAARQAPFPDW